MPRRTWEPTTSPRRIGVAIRRAKALEMRAAGLSYQDIVAAGLGYKTRAAAAQDVQRALAETVGEPAAEVRVLELLRLDQALRRLEDDEAKVIAVRDREHVTVSHGRVVYVKVDGVEKPLIDDGPVLQANAQLMAIEDRRNRIQERRAKYLGLDAPTKVEVMTDESVDAEIRRLTDELERAAATQAAGVEEPTD